MQRFAGAVIAICLLPSFIAADPRAPETDVLSRVRFSPDGRYILAQDPSGITVLTARPLAVLFRLPAPDAEPAEFTSDSQQIVFIGSKRVEHWSVESQRFVSSREIPPLGCKSIKVAPSGSLLACDDTHGNLHLVDLTTGKVIMEQKKFARPFVTGGTANPSNQDWDSEFPRGYAGNPGLATIEFSPDSRFMIAAPTEADGRAIGWDLIHRKRVPLTGDLKNLNRAFFLFVGPDRLLVSQGKRTGWWVARYVRSSGIVGFPAGREVSVPNLPTGLKWPVRPTDPSLMIISSGLHGAAVEFRTGQAIISSSQALDVLDKYYTTGMPDGRLGLYERGTGLVASVRLDRQ